LVRAATLAEGPLFSSKAALAVGLRLGISADAAYKGRARKSDTGVAS